MSGTDGTVPETGDHPEDTWDPEPGSPDAIAIRLATQRDAVGDEVIYLPPASEGSDELDNDVAEAVADVSDLAGPDEDDAEAWVNEVQGT